MNEQYSWDDWCAAIDTVMADTGIRSRADAAEIAKRRYPHLANIKYPTTGSGLTSQTQSGGPSGFANAEQQLNALAKRIAAERRCTFAQAYVAALNENPSLYLDYLREHERSLGARRV